MLRHEEFNSSCTCKNEVIILVERITIYGKD